MIIWLDQFRKQKQITKQFVSKSNGMNDQNKDTLMQLSWDCWLIKKTFERTVSKRPALQIQTIIHHWFNNSLIDHFRYWLTKIRGIVVMNQNINYNPYKHFTASRQSVAEEDLNDWRWEIIYFIDCWKHIVKDSQ